MSDEEGPFSYGSAAPDPGNQVVNPVEVEQNLLRLANDLGRSARGVSEALRAFRDNERAYDLAYARAYARYSGAAHAKRYAADELTMDEREKRDDAEVVWKYSAQRARALELELSAWQTIARSVGAMYGAAGVSGGA